MLRPGFTDSWENAMSRRCCSIKSRSLDPTAVIDPGSGNASALEPEFGSRVRTNVTRAGIAPKCRTLALCAIDRTSGRCRRTRISPDYLRRLSEGAQKGAAHAVAIAKTGLPRDDVNRMAALLHHQPGGLDP